MTKEEKLVVIDNLAEQLQAYPHFYIADIESLNAEQTAAAAPQVLRERRETGGREEHPSGQGPREGGEGRC